MLTLIRVFLLGRCHGFELNTEVQKKICNNFVVQAYGLEENRSYYVVANAEGG